MTGWRWGLSDAHFAAVLITASCGLHNFGFEYVRAASLTLFSEHCGPMLMPLAVVIAPGMIAVLLSWYRRTLAVYGAHAAVLTSTLLCITILTVCTLCIAAGGRAVAPAVFFLYVFRQAYITFLTAQLMSRLTSCLQKNEAANVFGPVLATLSVLGSLGGLTVKPLVIRYSETGLIVACVLALVGSLLLSHASYRTYAADEDRLHGVVTPSLQPRRPEVAAAAAARANGAFYARPRPGSDDDEDEGEEGVDEEAAMLVPGAQAAHSARAAGSSRARARDGVAVLVKQVWDALGLGALRASPVLPPLFVATVTMQAFSWSIFFAHNAFLRNAVTANAEQSAFTGHFFAAVKMLAAIVQLCGVRYILQGYGVSRVLRILPVVPFILLVWVLLRPSLMAATLLRGTYKLSEYAVFASAKELLYVPLSFEARYVGKEVVDVLGHRLGRATAAVGMGFLVWCLHSPTPRQLSAAVGIAGFAWVAATLRLQRAVEAAHEPSWEPRGGGSHAADKLRSPRPGPRAHMRTGGTGGAEAAAAGHTVAVGGSGGLGAPTGMA